MKLEIEPYSCLCHLATFKINGISASYNDFGDKYDHASWEAPEYGCGDMRFESKPASQEVLDTYRITIDEYNEICEKLAEVLDFGCCAWCS